MVILITGTRKGIGKALAELYLAAGNTVIGCSRKPSHISHDKYEHHIVDITQEKPVKLMFKSIRASYDCLDVLINNAGDAVMNHAMITPLSTWQRLMDINVLGSFLCCREAAKMFKVGGGGRIINFSSVSLPLRLEGSLAYTCSKSAVVTMTEILSRELADYGVTVNAIGPAPISTSLTRTVPRERMSELVNKQSIKRQCKIQDITHVTDFLIDKKCELVTGQTIYLGGVF